MFFHAARKRNPFIQSLSESSNFYLSNVGDIAVLHHVVSDGSSAEVVGQLQEQEAPVQLLEEDVVEAVGEAGQELAHHSEQQETLPAVLV